MGRLLGEIYHRDGLDVAGGVVERTAVRAVILRGRELLLLHSPHNGDYKFPGGGVERGETGDDALRRELEEECGAQLNAIGEEYGYIIEYSAAAEDDVAVFRMVSRYIRCEIADEFGPQRLEQYEQDLGLTPTWVDVAEALQVNEAALHADAAQLDTVRWRRRETLALRLIQGELLSPRQQPDLTCHDTQEERSAE